MMSDEHPKSQAHFSGFNTRFVVEYLGNRTPPGTLATVLHAAGETRPIEVLLDDASWSSYDQMRRLLEATGVALGGPRTLKPIPLHARMQSESVPEIHNAALAAGSPALLYAEVARGNNPGLNNICSTSGGEVGPQEWIIMERYDAGFAPFPELCSLLAGFFATMPRIFGYPPATVTEEECQAEGAPQCRFHITWKETDDPLMRAELLEARTRSLEMRLKALRQTVADIVSADSIDTALTRVITAAAHTVIAPAHMLVLASETFGGRPVYAVNLGDDEARQLRDDVLAQKLEIENDYLVVDVVSTRCDYGKLVAIDRTKREFRLPERSSLEDYARLAAIALDSAAALEDARREAATARALLDLSTALSEIASLEEIATKLARAVPAVVDCDRSLVVLFDPDTDTGRVAATSGYPDDVATHVQAIECNASTIDATAIQFYDATPDGPLAPMLYAGGDLAGAVSVGIVANGVAIGRVVATVTESPERLRRDPELAEKLRGLAGHAATAVNNSRLLDRIRHQALHDTLTGLPNRALILDRVASMLARARRQHLPAAALFIDLDGFKDINDTLGHGTGDRLLQAVAARLSTVLRDSDSIGRLGGDEFVVLVEGASLDAGPELVGERLLNILREPFEVEGYRGTALTVTASIGIAVGDRASPGELLRDADVALYRAKANGKNRFVIFESAMRDAVTDRMKLDMDLHGALERGEFMLVYQPIFDLGDGRVTGSEALLRWHHPTRGIVMPESFVPLLEESGRIVPVGRWVLFEACRQTALWHERGHPVDIAVNFSVRQLETDDFVSDIHRALTESGIDPASLIMEITETAIMRDAEATACRLRKVKDLGVRIAIDDFGTGYSSLAYLRQFPVDALKIDRSFISAIADSPEGGALTHMLVQLGKSLGLETLAEGIEEQMQYSHLRREDCDSGQGFLLAKPLDAKALGDFLDTNAADRATTDSVAPPAVFPVAVT